MRLSLKRIFVWLAVAFVVVMIWNDPTGSAPVIGDFLGTVGHWIMVAFQKVASFLGGLGA